MDKHQFHYGRSIFAYWANLSNKWGWFWSGWSGPEAWKNKYISTGFKALDLLQRTAFVWLTDVWHFAQFMMFTSYQIGLAWCLIKEGYMLGASSELIAGAVWVLILKAAHGIAFNPLFYKLLDGPAKATNTNS